MKIYRKGFIAIFLLIGIASAALAFIVVWQPASAAVTPNGGTTNQEMVAINSKLVQNKVLIGSNGRIGTSLTLTGANIPLYSSSEVQPVDLVVVLDRSGSMKGKKMHDARIAVIRLMEKLSPQDRIAIITYSNGVETLSPLVHMNYRNLKKLSAAVRRIQSSGGTNLGGGLQQGIATLIQTSRTYRHRKVILISDGLANQGITDPETLGTMAANGTEYNLGVSTVGVGYDFNEILMTTIADHGSGNYYFLENPEAFAEVFEKEFETTRNVVAGALEIRIPLNDGIQLINAGGYPIKNEGDVAILRPGDLLASQQRNLFLSFSVPTQHERNFSFGNIEVQYQHRGEMHTIIHSQELTVACVDDREAVIASIDKDIWSKQVIREDYNMLKNDVANAIRKGEKEEALQSIQEYETRNRMLNSSVGSASVGKNLDNDVQILRQSVKDTFTGAPAAITEKKKQNAKVLQYESYQIRRDKR